MTKDVYQLTSWAKTSENTVTKKFVDIIMH